MSDTRHRQLSRIYSLSIESDDDARAAIRRNPGILASALFEECAQSDDVTSIETARVYLEDRLEFLGDLVAEDAGAVRQAFEARVAAWG